MSPIVPLTQEPHALIETSTSDEQANIHRATESAKFRTTSASFLESRMLRWIAAALMLALLAWMMLFSEKSSEPSNSLSTSSPAPLNGTELLVRAYKIPDPNTSGTGQRSFSGTLQARYQSLLGFRVAGKIVQRLVEVGDRVKKGQVLFKLDPTDYDLQLQVAQADLEAAKSQLVQIEAEERRLSDLRKTRSASQSDHDLAVAARDTARSRLQAAINREMLARNQREYADLVADQDGLVTRLMAEIGQVTSAGQPVAQWVHGTELEAVVSVPESMQQSLKDSQASVEFWSKPGLRIPCKLREISPVADPASRTYDARFTLIDPPGELSIGMTANVVIYRNEDDGFSIPMGAIAQSQGEPIVWRILDQGRVESVTVQIVKYGSQYATVRGTLGPGDQIVSAGVQRIDPQCKVRVWQDNL
ncbi:MAG: efflux RND transporter periplasmic adaptor subunit [Pirellula sp.]|jgi:multidrug efflux system membrane fusion protein